MKEVDKPFLICMHNRYAVVSAASKTLVLHRDHAVLFPRYAVLSGKNIILADESFKAFMGLRYFGM